MLNSEILSSKKRKLFSRKKLTQSEPFIWKHNKKRARIFSIPSCNMNSKPSTCKNPEKHPVHPNTDRKLNIYKSDEYLLVDIGIERELGLKDDSNYSRMYESLQQYINYEDIEDLLTLSSQNLCESMLSGSSVSTTLISSKTLDNISFSHKLIQTEYDPEFELWYKNKFESFLHRDFLQNKDQIIQNVRLSCVRKHNTMTSFSDTKEEKETPTKVEHVRRNKKRNIRKKKTKPHEKKRKISRCQFCYHKTKSLDNEIAQYWVSLDLLRSPQTSMEDDIKNEEKTMKEDSIEMSKMHLNWIKKTFDKFDTDKQVLQISERSKQKGLPNRMKEPSKNLQQIQFTKYLRLLGDMQALYEIEDDILFKMTDDNMMKTTTDDIKYIELLANQTIPISFHYDHKHQELFKNDDFNPFKKCTIDEFPNDLRTAMDNFDKMFYVNDKRCATTSSKKLTKKNVNQKISRNGISNTGINHDSLYPIHITKVKALTKQLSEVLIILQTLQNVELELPSHTNIVDELINDIPCPKVFDNTSLEPFKDYKIDFTIDLTSVPNLSDFEFGFKWDSKYMNVSQWSPPSTKKKFKSKIPVVDSYKYKARKSMMELRKIPQGDKPSMGNKFIVNSSKFNKLKFELPKLNLVGMSTVTRVVVKITKDLNQMLELVYMWLMPHFRPMLNIAHMMSPIEIDCTPLTTNMFKSCIELQYKRENYIEPNLNFENLIDMTCYKPYHHVENENILDQHFLVSALSENFLYQINSFIRSTLKNTLKCVMSTRPVILQIAHKTNKEAINKEDDDHKKKGINIAENENPIAASASQTSYQNKNEDIIEASYYTCNNITPLYSFNSKAKMSNVNVSHNNQHSGEKIYSPQNPKFDSLVHSLDKRVKINRRNKIVPYVKIRKSRFKFNQNVFRDCKNDQKTDGEFKSNVQPTEKIPDRVIVKNEPNEPYYTKLGVKETTSSTDVIPASSKSTSETTDSLAKINNFSTHREKKYCKALPRPKTDSVDPIYKEKNKPARIASQENSMLYQKEDLNQNCDSILDLYLSLSSRTSVEARGDYSTEDSADINRQIQYNKRSKNKSKRKVLKSPGKSSGKIQSLENTEGHIHDFLKKEFDVNQKLKNSKNRDKLLKENDSILELYTTLTSSDTSLLSFEKLYSINNDGRSTTRRSTTHRSKTPRGNKKKLAFNPKKSSEEIHDNDSILDLYLSVS